MDLSDVQIVLRSRVIPCGTLRMEKGVITEITETSGPATHTVFPGFVDMHGDMIELEIEPRRNVDFPMHVALAHLDARLAATGVTTAYAGVSFSRNAMVGERRSYTHTCAVIRALHAARDSMRVDHRIHARFDITYTTAIAGLESLLQDRAVDLVSVMDHTPGQGQYRDIERLIASRAAQGKTSTDEARRDIQAKVAAAAPAQQTLANLRKVAALCREHGIALASHDDDTAEKAALMADTGAVISEFPVTLEAARAAVDRGLMTAMGAPNAMRGESYSGNLSARQAHAEGLLSILAADYHPAAILPAIRALAQSDPDGLPGAVRMATAHPAEALGLSDRGEIAVGKRADLVVVDDADRVAVTLVSGHVAYANGTY